MTAPTAGHAHGGGHAHAHPHRDPASARVVLALGPESEGMPDLGLPSAAPGRGLAELVGPLVESGELVVVVPMSFGRAPTTVADCARTLRDVRGRAGGGPAGADGHHHNGHDRHDYDAHHHHDAHHHDGHHHHDAHHHDGHRDAPALALAAPLGDATMLVTRLRAAIRRHGEVCSALVVSRSIDPFADAELYRLARLARQYGAPGLVEVAFHGGDEPDPDLAEGLERIRALGGRTPAIVSATLAPAPEIGVGLPGEGELLFGPAVLRSVIDTRVREAVHRLDHGDDGIDPALDAEDGHGYAHSHVAADGTVYTHSH